MKKIIFLLSLFFLFNINVYADCSTKEELDLNVKAANVKRSYELYSDNIDYETGNSQVEYFIITLLNITDGLYVKVTDDLYKNERIYVPGDMVDGKVTFTWTDIDVITKFDIEIYSDTSTNCPNKLLRKISLTTPRYNGYYNRGVCDGLEDYYLCQKYITVGDISEEEFMERIDSYLNGDEDKNGEKTKTEKDKSFWDIIKDNIGYIAGGGVIIIGGIGISIYLKKTKKQRELGI